MQDGDNGHLQPPNTDIWRVSHRHISTAFVTLEHGEQAMEEAFGNSPLDPGQPNHDMLQRVQGMIPVSLLTFASRWIESHQDDFKSAKHLDQWGKLNAECDRLAKSF
jgi:hypothetical protein